MSSSDSSTSSDDSDSEDGRDLSPNEGERKNVAFSFEGNPFIRKPNMVMNEESYVTLRNSSRVEEIASKIDSNTLKKELKKVDSFKESVKKQVFELRNENISRFNELVSNNSKSLLDYVKKYENFDFQFVSVKPELYRSTSFSPLLSDPGALSETFSFLWLHELLPFMTCCKFFFKVITNTAVSVSIPSHRRFGWGQFEYKRNEDAESRYFKLLPFMNLILSRFANIRRIELYYRLGMKKRRNYFGYPLEINYEKGQTSLSGAAVSFSKILQKHARNLEILSVVEPTDYLGLSIQNCSSLHSLKLTGCLVNGMEKLATLRYLDVKCVWGDDYKVNDEKLQSFLLLLQSDRLQGIKLWSPMSRYSSSSTQSLEAVYLALQNVRNIRSFELDVASGKYFKYPAGFEKFLCNLGELKLSNCHENPELITQLASSVRRLGTNLQRVEFNNIDGKTTEVLSPFFEVADLDLSFSVHEKWKFFGTNVKRMLQGVKAVKLSGFTFLCDVKFALYKHLQWVFKSVKRLTVGGVKCEYGSNKHRLLDLIIDSAVKNTRLESLRVQMCREYRIDNSFLWRVKNLLNARRRKLTEIIFDMKDYCPKGYMYDVNDVMVWDKYLKDWRVGLDLDGFRKAINSNVYVQNLQIIVYVTHRKQIDIQKDIDAVLEKRKSKKVKAKKKIIKKRRILSSEEETIVVRKKAKKKKKKKRKKVVLVLDDLSD